jgi:hypothetical protein
LSTFLESWKKKRPNAQRRIRRRLKSALNDYKSKETIVTANPVPVQCLLARMETIEAFPTCRPPLATGVLFAESNPVRIPDADKGLH